MSHEPQFKSVDPATDKDSSGGQLELMAKQLSQLTDLTSELRADLAAAKASRAGWILFYKIVLIHALAMTFGLIFLSDANDSISPMLIYGCWTGGLATLSTWHGLSLRPFGERWLRSTTAIVIVVAAVSLHEDYEVFSLAIIFGAFILYGGGSAIIAARITRGVMKAGLLAPDGDSIQPKPISLAAFFVLAACIAVLLTLSSFASEVLGDSSTLLPVCIYGAGIGAFFSVSVVLLKKRTLAYQRALVVGELMLTVFIFNILMMFVVIYMEQGDLSSVWDSQAFYESIPQFTAYWFTLMISPAVTLAILLANGHSIIFYEHSPEQKLTQESTAFDDIE